MTDLDQRIAALREAVSKMTPGEWTAADNKSGTATILYCAGRRVGELYSYSVYEPREDERRANGNALAMLQTCALAIIDEQAAEIERLRARVAELEAEQEKLIADIQTYVGITAEQNAENQALQARIDELMWEFCPNEMTPEQLAEWEKHQVPVRDAGPTPLRGRVTRRDE